MTRFGRVLGLSLAVLWALLVAAAWAQVTVGLAPLRALQQAVLALREGRAARIAADTPTELLPLVQGFNAVLERNDEMVERARQQAGNLAHAVKTPLAVMAQAASRDGTPLGAAVREQTEAARRQVDWHLARARAAAHKVFGAEQVPLAPLVAGLLRVVQRVYADRGLRVRVEAIDPAAREVILEAIVRDLSPDAIVIISTHLIHDLEPVLDGVAFMRHGRVLLAGQVDDLRAERGMSIDELFREVYRWSAH